MQLLFPKDKTVAAWEMFLWNLPDDFLSHPQKLQFMLMLDGQFNQFDPYLVIRDLLENRDQWIGVIMDRAFRHETKAGKYAIGKLVTDLIKLRDIASGYWNVDTVFLLVSETHAVAMEKLAQRWSADNIVVLNGKETDEVIGVGRADSTERLISVWWD